MANAATVASFQAACVAIADAIDAGTWSTAYTKWGVAEALNAALELEVGDQGARIRRRESLSGLKTAITAAETKSKSSSGKRFARARLGPLT